MSMLSVSINLYLTDPVRNHLAINNYTIEGVEGFKNNDPKTHLIALKSLRSLCHFYLSTGQKNIKTDDKIIAIKDIWKEIHHIAYKTMCQWIKRHPPGEYRQTACNRIQNSYEDKDKSLDLATLHISSLPNELCFLAHLTKINLSENQIETLPICFSFLRQLVFLDLSSNKIKYIPEDLCFLEKLSFLNLSFNEIESIPESFINLKKLKFLGLTNNKITIIPSFISTLTNLKDVFFSHNQIQSIPEEIQYLVNIQTLTLNSNNITIIPQCMQSLVNLEILFLSNNPIASIPHWINSLKTLKDQDF